VEHLFDMMKKTIESGEDLLISGFGKFVVKQKGPAGQKPQTSEELQLRQEELSLLRLQER